ncbi:uncharacterized protein K460DRAFT_362128 [Cucurbitaria berberidis CBS 394.84]|uniref:Uncharacterized protein n=1 Tax=Cucurbitaria berberidis CBS 394.84 TaxID=1168544 RepID=A0A9P4GRS7_9PLEO|nr:uncharacterized protein K460DRAFT_362128 [Cucurbitaria berberidis CBS 394.84]KAF1851383.1 hypothetical protein K460DRAFT_362128 [Cucurbitaria berberidis CBS 394.84]
MGIGIALGNTVDSVGPALQKGEFVGVSIPIGTYCSSFPRSFTTTKQLLLQQLACLS